ncbi:MAG: hypothetical protein JSV91_12240 [Phycisphaerales bacterium]|nr:MAG: hypothetical protein JSV91_12240 [Phycisphaerales bacterium]
MGRFLINLRQCQWIVGLLLLLLLPVGRALGQGTGGFLPDPISSGDLDRYARRLELSDEQRQGLDAFHSEYLIQFDDLRQREIEEFITRMQEVRRGIMRLQNVKEVKKAFRDLDRLLSKIRSLDDRFFEQARTVLSESQQATFPRVRQQRERSRYRLSSSLIGGRNPAVSVDLSGLPILAELSPQQIAAVDPALVEYERRLTADLRELHEIGSSAVLDAIRKMEELGFTEEMVEDREVRWQMYDAFRTVLREITEKVAKRSAKISELNHSVLRQMASVLPEEESQELRWQYQRSAYPEIPSRGAQVVARHDAALQLDRLSEVQRQAIAAARDDFIRKDNRLADDMVELLDEERQSSGFMRFGPDERRTERRRKLRELHDEAEELRVAALDALKTTLGPDLTEAMAGKVEAGASDGLVETRPLPPSFTEGGFTRGRRGGAPWQSMGIAVPVEEGENDNLFLFLPGPIAARDVDNYPQRVGIPEDSRVILDALYGDYRDAHERWVQTHLEPLRTHQRTLWAIDPDSGRASPPSEADIDRLFDLRNSALEALRALDRDFFDNVGLLVTAPEGEAQPLIQRLRLIRDRDIYRVASQSPVGGGGGRNRMIRIGGGLEGEGAVDIILLLDEINLTASDLLVIRNSLAVWEQSMTAALRSRYETADRVGRASAKMTSQMGRRGEDRGRRPAFNERTFEIMREGRQQISQSDDQLTSLNRRAIDEMTAALPEAPSWALRRAFHRAAFPEVFADPGSVEPLLVSALALEDLAAPQRQRIVELQAEYRAEYAAVCDEMIQTQLLLTQGDSADGRPDWGRRTQARSATERLEFQRSEINSKTLLKLRGLLSEEQMLRIPGLSDTE